MKWITAFLGVLFILLVPEVAFAASATLSLSPSTGTFNTGCSYSIDILLNTDNTDTDGTDAIVIYDQTRIGPTATPITVGTLYSDYPAQDFSNGNISISGIVNPGQVYNSKGTSAKFATINFSVPQSAPIGATDMTIKYEGRDVTTDSNVVQTGVVQNILGSVVNGSYTIANGTSCSAVASTTQTTSVATSSGTPGIGDFNSTPSASVALQGCQGQLCKTADVTPTLVLSALGGFLVLLGAGGLVALRK